MRSASASHSVSRMKTGGSLATGQEAMVSRLSFGNRWFDTGLQHLRPLP